MVFGANRAVQYTLIKVIEYNIIIISFRRRSSITILGISWIRVMIRKDVLESIEMRR